MDVFIVPGFHVPVIPLFEIRGKVTEGLFWQNGPIGSKSNVIALTIVTVKLDFKAH